MTKSETTLAALALLLALAAAPARDLYVAHSGDDRADGLTWATAVRTIARGLALAAAGDTVRLAPGVYHESANFHNRSGEAGRPLTLDGGGATLDGADVLPDGAWTQVSPGLWRTTSLPTADNVVMRWYFLFEGRPQHMGRTSKGPKATLKQPDALRPGEWTCQPAEKAYYVKLEPGRTPREAGVAAPVRVNGVGLSGRCEHLVIANLIATHVWNDGYNIHNYSRDVVFRDVRAVDCGDDGLSAHEDCQVTVDGLFVSGCSTGLCNIGASQSDCARVLVRNCLAFEYYMLETGRHTLRRSRLLSRSASGVVVSGGKPTDPPCRVEFEDVLVQREAPGARCEVRGHAAVAARRVTLMDLPLLLAGGALSWQDSLVLGPPAAEVNVSPTAQWTAARNGYAVRQFRYGNQVFAPAQFTAWQQATGQDADSRVLDGAPPAGMGADAAVLPAP